MSARPLTSPRAIKRREQLLEISLEMFAERDYDDVSVDDVAERAGVSHGLVFQYFGSKRGLYIATIEPLLARFRDRTRVPPGEMPPPERLRHAVGAYFDAVTEHPLAYRSLMGGGAGFQEVFDRVELARWEGAEYLAENLGLDFDRPEVKVVVRGWIGFLDGAIRASVGAGPERREQVIDIVTSVLPPALEAIGTTPAPKG